jgi:hypothetical protein
METITGLADGLTDTAGRVRRGFAAAAPEAAWSPELTAASLRQTAASAAVISHHCQLIQQTLASHATEFGLPGLAQRLRTSSRAAGRARQAWLQATISWESIQTDTTKGTPPLTAEVTDLVMWTGRLADNDPNWSPAMRKASAARTGPALASTPADLALVVDAVRQAASAVVAIAAADYTRIRTAAQSGRLLTPAGDMHASPERLPFTRASRNQTAGLLGAYRDAGTTSVQATAAADQIAGHIQDHNLHLSEQQRAEQDRTAGWRIAGRLASPQLDPASPAGIAEAKASRDMPGPPERRLIELGVTNPALMNRGTALDLAARQLIGEAAQETAPGRWNSAVTGRRPIVSADQVVNDVLARSRREPAMQSLPEFPEADRGGKLSPIRRKPNRKRAAVASGRFGGDEGSLALQGDDEAAFAQELHRAADGLVCHLVLLGKRQFSRKPVPELPDLDPGREVVGDLRVGVFRVAERVYVSHAGTVTHL